MEKATNIFDNLFSRRLLMGDQVLWATSLPAAPGYVLLSSPYHGKWAIAQLGEEEFSDRRAFDEAVDNAAHDLMENLPFEAQAPAEGNEPGIQSLFLHITSRCNLKCRHCYYIKDDTPRAQDLTTGDIEKIIRRFTPLGLKRVTLSGGEPLLHPDFPAIVDMVHHHGLASVILSNGILFTKENIGLLGPKDYVLISLHGPDAPTHDRQNGPGTFDKAVRGIKLLMGRIPPENIIVNCTMSDWNIDRLDDMVNLTASLGLSRIRFMPLHGIGIKTIAGPTFDYHSEKVRRWAQKAARAITADKWPVHVDVGFTGLPGYLGDFPDDFGKSVCGVGQRLTVASDGSFHLCPCLMGGEFAIGDSGCADSADKVAARLGKWKDKTYRRRYEIEDCRNCPLSGICQAGCPALAYQKYGSFQAVDPLCAAIREFSFEYFSQVARRCGEADQDS